MNYPARGFTFPLGNKDVFIVTNRKKKTESLCRMILRAMELPENPSTIREIMYYLVPAEIEIRKAKSGREFYEIHGLNFGGRGSWCDDDRTIVKEI